MRSKHKILILGPQGSGKGTQANILANKLGIPALSMGALLRDAAGKGGETGEEIARIQKIGALVPDEVAGEIFLARINERDAENGYIIDGYPRNEAQYKVYVSLDTPTAVIVITVPHDVSVQRLHDRAMKEGRVDDTVDVITRRLQIYHDETQPMISHFHEHGIVHEVDGVGTVEEVAERIGKIFL